MIHRSILEVQYFLGPFGTEWELVLECGHRTIVLRSMARPEQVAKGQRWPCPECDTVRDSGLVCAFCEYECGWFDRLAEHVREVHAHLPRENEVEEITCFGDLSQIIYGWSKLVGHDKTQITGTATREDVDGGTILRIELIHFKE